MSNKVKNELVFIITALVIGILYFRSQHESNLLLTGEIIFVLTFAIRKIMSLAVSFRMNRKRKDHISHNGVRRISAKY